jgi:hypothetical protein
MNNYLLTIFVTASISTLSCFGMNRLENGHLTKQYDNNETKKTITKITNNICKNMPRDNSFGTKYLLTKRIVKNHITWQDPINAFAKLLIKGLENGGPIITQVIPINTPNLLYRIPRYRYIYWDETQWEIYNAVKYQTPSSISYDTTTRQTLAVNEY